MSPPPTRKRLVWTLAFLAVCSACGSRDAGEATLLHVSYDATRELFDAYDGLFAAHWHAEHGQTVRIRRSHGGSGKQARAVLDGLDADVVSLALAYDIDALTREPTRVAADWPARLPDESSPFTSTIVFLVRRGNPKHIHDWSDLVRPGVGVIAPNPKTSGAARWVYLAAWGAARLEPGGTDESARRYVKSLYQHVLVLDAGARGSSTTFTRNQLGDVLLTWESEALLIMDRMQSEGFERVIPQVSILAEPVATWVDATVERRHTRELAEAYLRYLYSEEAQRIVAEHGYRTRSSEAFESDTKRFPELRLFTVREAFGGWQKANADHFAEGASFDSIYLGGK